MEITTQMRNVGNAGWRATSSIPLGTRQELHLSTRRTDDGHLVTSASVMTIDGAFRRFVFGTNGAGDFYQRLYYSRPARVTQKVVQDQHQRALGRIDELKLKAQNYYADRSESSPPGGSVTLPGEQA